MVVFDFVGTLFSVNKISEKLNEDGLQPELLPWWFARLLQTSMSVWKNAGHFRETLLEYCRRTRAGSGNPCLYP